MGPSPGTPGFVGRDVELGRLAGCLRDAVEELAARSGLRDAQLL